MPLYVDETKIKKIVYKGTNIKKVYCNGTLVFNSDHVVTYQIKSQRWTAVIEDGENAATTLANTTAASKMGSGDTFKGWTTVSGSTSPMSNIPCNADGIVLYGIWSHSHVGTNTTKAGCYQGTASTYNPVSHIGSEAMIWDPCGCRHQTHHYRCSICGSTWDRTTNNSEDCTQGHNLSDTGSNGCIHNKSVTTYAVSCGKSEGTFCG